MPLNHTLEIVKRINVMCIFFTIFFSLLRLPMTSMWLNAINDQFLVLPPRAQQHHFTQIMFLIEIHEIHSSLGFQ